MDWMRKHESSHVCDKRRYQSGKASKDTYLVDLLSYAFPDRYFGSQTGDFLKRFLAFEIINISNEDASDRAWGKAFYLTMNIIEKLETQVEKDKEQYKKHISPYHFEALRNYDEKISGYEQTQGFLIDEIAPSGAKHVGQEIEHIIKCLKRDWLPIANEKGTLFYSSATKVIYVLNMELRSEKWRLR